MTNPNASFDDLLSTTLKNYRPTLVDNIFKATVVLNHLNERGRVVVETGGYSIVEPILWDTNGTAGVYAEYATIPLTPQDGISAAEYAWKNLAASIAISGPEEAKNRGKEAVIKLLNARIMQAEMSLKKVLNDQILDGSGAGNNLFGLDTIAATSGNSVGGIDAGTYTWWNPQIDSSTTTLDLDVMAALYNDCSNGTDVPDLIVAKQTQYQNFEGLLTNQVRYQDVAKANAGFQNLMFKQTPVVFDKALEDLSTTGDMFFLNSKYLKLTGMSDHWFETTDFQRGTVNGVDARYALILAYGALTCSNRSRQGAFTALT